MMTRCWCARLALAATALVVSGTVGAEELVSPWSGDRPETRSRLVAGVITGKPVAAVEVTLGEGWKTYWRFPGEAGGVPPVFDWSKSDNVATVTVLYPAPKRMVDKAGETLGYKSGVVFPVLVEPKDGAKPISLRLVLEYGVCRDICVPVESMLNLDIPAGATAAPPAIVGAAIDHVPRAGTTRRPNDPKLLTSEFRLSGPHPSVAFEAEFPGGTTNADVFIESPDGLIPLPKPGSGKVSGPNRLRFEIDLTGGVDPADIKGKNAIITLVSEQGLSETTITLD